MTENTKKVKQLLEKGAYYSPRDILESTLLLNAAKHDHRKVIRFLLAVEIVTLV